MNRIVKFFCDIFNRFWVHWSNLRFRKSCRFDNSLDDEDVVLNWDHINSLVNRLYDNFKYKKDSIDQLGDAVIPPSEAYRKYRMAKLFDTKHFKDDCDGFHSLVYHCLKNSGIKCYLLCVNAKGCGHCVCVFKYKDVWHVCDYTTFIGLEVHLKDAIKHYNSYFEDCYSGGKKVFYNCLLKYDYKKGKFKFLNYYKTLKAD